MKNVEILKYDDIDFHDSSLLSIDLKPTLDEIEVKLNIQDGRSVVISFRKILSFFYETTGFGMPEIFPVEIYEIYLLREEKYSRWLNRLEELGSNEGSLYNIILASSYYQGWGENNSLEGLDIVCKELDICVN